MFVSIWKKLSLYSLNPQLIQCFRTHKNILVFALVYKEKENGSIFTEKEKMMQQKLFVLSISVINYS